MHNDRDASSERRPIPADGKHTAGNADSEFPSIRIAHDYGERAQIIRIVRRAGRVVMVVLSLHSKTKTQNESQKTEGSSKHLDLLLRFSMALFITNRAGSYPVDCRL